MRRPTAEHRCSVSDAHLRAAAGLAIENIRFDENSIFQGALHLPWRSEDCLLSLFSHVASAVGRRQVNSGEGLAGRKCNESRN